MPGLDDRGGIASAPEPVRPDAALTSPREHGSIALLAGPRIGSRSLVVTRVVMESQDFRDEHYHDDEKVLYAESGEVEVLLDGCAHRLGAGDAVTIPAGCVHDFRSVRGTAQVLLIQPRVFRIFEPDGTEVLITSIAAAVD